MKAPINPPKNGYKIIFTLLLLGLGVVLIYQLLGPKKNISSQSVTLSDLKGVWTTPYPKYQDRFLQFDDESITFGWGPDGMGSYTIDEFNSNPEAAGILVHVQYRDLAENTYQFNFYYLDQDGGLLWMKNQQGIYWLPANDQPVHHPQFK